MKSTKKLNFLMIFLAVFLAQTNTYADRGGASSGGGGGDGYAAEFVHTAISIYAMLKRQKKPLVNPDQFKMAFDHTRVFSKKALSLNGQEVDAINYPDDHRIVVSRARWKELSEQPRNKLVLVAHEYFGIMGLNDKSYQLSKSIFDAPGNPVVEYTCKPFREGDIVSKNTRMKFTIYGEGFNLITFSDSKGEPLQDDLLSATYLFQFVNEIPEAKIMVTMTQLALAQRMIFLDYPAKKEKGYFKTKDVTNIDPIETKDGSAYCTVYKSK